MFIQWNGTDKAVEKISKLLNVSIYVNYPSLYIYIKDDLDYKSINLYDYIYINPLNNTFRVITLKEYHQHSEEDFKDYA